jgi:hypothetical protein
VRKKNQTQSTKPTNIKGEEGERKQVCNPTNNYIDFYGVDNLILDTVCQTRFYNIFSTLSVFHLNVLFTSYEISSKGLV